MSAEHYLGDGLYVRRDVYGTVWLRAPRARGDHVVALEPEVLAAFLRWLNLPRQEPIGEASVPQANQCNQPGVTFESAGESRVASTQLDASPVGSLLQRLREFAPQMGHYGAHCGGVLMEHAADEIERLQRELQSAKMCMPWMFQQISQQSDRLLAALFRIRDARDARGYTTMSRAQMREIANDALDNRPTPSELSGEQS